MSLWPNVCEQLGWQSPAHVRDWLQQSQATRTNGQIVIATPSQKSADWLNHHYKKQIQKTIESIIGRPANIAIVANETPNAAPTPTTMPDHIKIRLVHFDPREAGFLMLPHYTNLFWQPLLGEKAYTLWLTLLSLAQVTQQNQHPISHIAAICANGNRQRITGRGTQPGLLHLLKEQHIINFTISNEGTTKQTYFINARVALPLLTPKQVKRLTASTQALHEIMLNRSTLNKKEWAQITADTLTEPLEQPQIIESK